MRITLLTLLLGSAIAAANRPQMYAYPQAQNMASAYQDNTNLLPQMQSLSSQGHPSAKAPVMSRKLSLGMNPSAGIAGDLQFQKMFENFQQMQQANQPQQAQSAQNDQADSFTEAQPFYPSEKASRGLRTQLVSKNNYKRSLDDEEPAGEGAAEEEAGGASAGGSKGDLESSIDKLLARANAVDDKIDHLLFHNHHDLAGTTAHYTPYGVQMLPSTKGPNSVDQKLKMIDYMHNLGGGYNPMLHSMLPFYLGHSGEQDKGIKMDGLMGMGMNNAATAAARKRKRLL